jgi:hypothetical protein
MGKVEIEVDESGQCAELVGEYANCNVVLTCVGSMHGSDPGCWSHEGYPADPGEFIPDYPNQLVISVDDEVQLDSDEDDIPPEMFNSLADRIIDDFDRNNNISDQKLDFRTQALDGGLALAYI